MMARIETATNAQKGTMFAKLRYRWHYPKCFRWQLPHDHALYLWVASPLWRNQWLRPALHRNPDGLLKTTIALGPLELTLTYPHWSRLARPGGG
jgi:hypothetical protein